MISKNIIEAVVKQAKPADKDMILSAFITKLGNNRSYNDSKVNHCLELLLGGTKFIEPDDINIDYIKKNINKYIYKSEDYIIKDIKLEYIDNIECLVGIGYKYKEKVNEDRDDIDFSNCIIDIDFICIQEVLK